MVDLPEPLGSGVVFIAACAVVFVLSVVFTSGVFFTLWLKAFLQKVLVRWRSETKAKP